MSENHEASQDEAVTQGAEHRLRKWSSGLEALETIDHDRVVEELDEAILPYITVSREYGAGSTEIVARIQKRLGCDVVDQELLEYLADRYKLPRDMLEVVDEKACNWLVEAVGIWLTHRIVSQSDYVALVGRFALMAARTANAIFIGRGVQFILPREKGISIRIVGPLEQRIARIMEVYPVTRSLAERQIKKQDAARKQFIRHHYHLDASDPLLYDLVINTERIDFDAAADIVSAEWRRRFG